MPKVKFFAWLLLMDRLNTRNVLRQRHKHFEEGYNCVMCHENMEEMTMHLFFECSSNIMRWYIVNIQWNIQGSLFQMLARQKSTSNSPYLLDIVMIVDWSIWKERNAYIFNGNAPSVVAWKAIFKSEVKLHLH